MQSFDHESLIFPENLATDQNKFDNGKEYEQLNKTAAEPLFNTTCNCMSKTTINADPSTFQTF